MSIADNLAELYQRLNSAELEARQKIEEAKKLAEKITSLEFQLSNYAAIDNQRKEELLAKERVIQSLQLEKMESLHEIKALQVSL